MPDWLITALLWSYAGAASTAALYLVYPFGPRLLRRLLSGRQRSRVGRIFLPLELLVALLGRTDNRLLVLLSFPLVLSVVSCGERGAEQAGGSPYDVRDSAGVTVTTSPGSIADENVGWSVAADPDLVIGAGDDPEHQLYRVNGLQPRADRGFVLMNAGTRQIRFYDSLGHVVEQVGRHGEGPGEFSDPVLVPTSGTDSLLVWDQDLMRFQVFDPTGSFIRTIRLVERWPNGARPPVGAHGVDVMLVGRSWNELFMVLQSRQVEGAKEVRTDYFWYDPSSGGTDSLVSYSVLGWYHWLPRGRPPSGGPVPLVPKPSAVVSNETALITDGAAFEVRTYDRQGHLRRISRLDTVPAPVTTEVLDRQAEEEAPDPQYVQATRQRYGEMPIPSLLPAFDTLLVDESGAVWARMHRVERHLGQAWVVFDEGGRALGRVETPAGLDVRVIGKDYLLGIWVDELGVEYVRRYRLSRTPAVH